MKKMTRKLLLHRETLHALDNLRNVVGGVSSPCTIPCGRRTEAAGCELGPFLLHLQPNSLPCIAVAGAHALTHILGQLVGAPKG